MVHHLYLMQHMEALQSLERFPIRYGIDPLLPDAIYRNIKWKNIVQKKIN